MTIETLRHSFALVSLRSSIAQAAPVPPGFDPAYPVYVSKAILIHAHLQDLIQAYDVPHDVYRVEGLWCKIMAEIPQ